MLANFSNLITFSRGSNATVTDASGRLTYAPHNLVTNSQDFEASAWTKTAASITANSAVAPDGTTTADTITEDTTPATAHRVYQVATNQTGPVIASIYVKAGTRSWLYIRMTDSASVVKYAYFNVSTGTLGTVDAGVTASITPAGNGWYRCAALVNAVISMTCVFAITDANGNPVHNGNGTGNLFIWGAQLEQVTYQTTPSPYVSTSVANLLGFSEDFTNAAWTKGNAAIVPNAAQNPINNLWNAQKLMENSGATGNKQVFQTQTLSAASRYTLSVYAKASERPGVILSFGSTSPWGGTGDQREAAFNLSTGTVISSTGSVTATITAIGNGWYRCAVQSPVTTASASSFPVVRLCDASGSPSYTGDGNSGIYIYGAQLSNSGSLDPYVPTPGAAPSSTAYYGPRFDYDPVTLAAKGILIEEQRTNLLTGSADFTATYWPIATNVVVTADNAASPDGASNADLMADNTAASAQHRLYRDYTFSAQAHTLSIHAKRNTHRWIRLLAFDGTNTFFANFDLQSGVVGAKHASATSTITNCGNGWYRCTMTATTLAAAGNIQIVMLDSDAATSPWLYTGTGTSFWAYGAQLEAGAFATSYIPTVASQVTRTADVASITGSLFSQWYRQDEGTFVTQFRPIGYTANSMLIAANDGGTNNLVMQYLSFPTDIRFTVRNATVDQCLIDSTFSASGVNKMASSYATNNFNSVTNGGTVGNDPSGTTPTLTTLGIGNRVGSLFWNGYIQSITYYPTRLTNDQLQAITK